MTEPEWERLKQIFAAALNVPREHRPRYVEGACPEPAMRASVLELLAAHDQASTSFLEPGTLGFGTPWLFAVGNRISDRFRIVRPIARGAMGEVYEVYDERLQARVALKAIRSELIGDRDTANRFTREVQVTRDISHPGLCRVFDIIEHPLTPSDGFAAGTSVPCLTMQLLDGESLESWLRSRRPLPVADALPIARQIIQALQVLHDHGIIHRDLKPSNVMLLTEASGARTAVLTDFGLAKSVDGGLFESQGDVHGGAPYYMAPELFRGQRPSRQSDIYAVGLLIDDMVTRERAFSTESLANLMLQKLGDPPCRASRRSTGLPATWDATLSRCLAPSPEDRFGRADEVLDGLEGRRRRFPDGAVRRPTWRALQAARRSPVRTTSAVAVVAAILGVGWLSRPAPPQVPTAVFVSPFDNLTSDRQLGYWCAGTATEIGRRLSHLPDVRVYMATPPSASSQSSADASFVVQGHLQAAGHTVRLSVQLVDRQHGQLVWSDEAEATGDRALALQDRLSAGVVGSVRRVVTVRARSSVTGFLRAGAGAAEMQSTSVPALTQNNAALDAYMRGHYLFEERTLPTALAAIESLTRATNLDPNFAAAYATLADVQGVLMDNNFAPHAELAERARGYAEQAVALDPTLPDAQVSLAAVRQMQRDWRGAEEAYRRAIDLHPTFARAYRWYAGLLLQFGRFDESVQLARKAVNLDPYDYPNRSALGFVLFYANQPIEAAHELEGALAEKDFLYGHAVLGQVYAALSGAPGTDHAAYLTRALRESDLLARPRTAPASAPPSMSDYADLVAALAWAYQHNATAAHAPLDRLERRYRVGHVSPALLARVYAVLGRSDDALSALEEGEARGDREMLYVKVAPFFQSLRGSNRYRAILARMQLR